jgi:hypothetical protein
MIKGLMMKAKTLERVLKKRSADCEQRDPLRFWEEIETAEVNIRRGNQGMRVSDGQ